MYAFKHRMSVEIHRNSVNLPEMVVKSTVGGKVKSLSY